MRICGVIAAVGAAAAVAHARSVEQRGLYEVAVGVSDSYQVDDGYSYGSPSPVAAPAPSNTQYVMVGGTAGLVYSPEYVYANVGDTIVFQFGAKNHTVTQSSFAQPCWALPGGINLLD